LSLSATEGEKEGGKKARKIPPKRNNALEKPIGTPPGKKKDRIFKGMRGRERLKID